MCFHHASRAHPLPVLPYVNITRRQLGKDTHRRVAARNTKGDRQKGALLSFDKVRFWRLSVSELSNNNNNNNQK